MSPGRRGCQAGPPAMENIPYQADDAQKSHFGKSEENVDADLTFPCIPLPIPAPLHSHLRETVKVAAILRLCALE